MKDSKFDTVMVIMFIVMCTFLVYLLVVNWRTPDITGLECVNGNRIELLGGGFSCS